MSISGISSTTSAYQADAQSALQRQKNDFMDLAESLDSGDLATAQKAFAALMQDLQSASAGQAQSSDQTGTTSQQTNDVGALAKALKSGDLAGAQKAFAALTQDIQGTGRAHHHHHHASSSRNATANPDSTSDANPQRIGTTIDVTV